MDDPIQLQKQINEIVDLYNYHVENVCNALKDLREQEKHFPNNVKIRWGFLNELDEMQKMPKREKHG